MGKWLLKIVQLFNPVFRRQGIDVDRLYTIVELKLLMDTRRVYMSWKQGQQKDDKNHLTTILILYGLFGIFMGVAIYSFPTVVTAMILFHSYVIFMMAMTLITDFSSVLLDTTDNQILLPRPVNSKTLFMARLIHVLLYLLQFSVAVCLAPVIATFFKYGPLVGLGMILTSQLTVLLAVFLTYLLYLMVLRFSSEQKIKEIVTYFQIAMTLFFTIGYQLIPRMIDLEGVSASFTLKWYSFLIPPVWMAMALESLYDYNFDLAHLVMFFLAVSVPLFLYWVMNKFLAPLFSKQLASLNNESQPSKQLPVVVQSRPGFSGRLASLFCGSPVEKGAFGLTWKMTGRDKAFRLQFYPVLGYIPIILFIFILNSGRNMVEHLEMLPSSDRFLFLIYLPLFAVASSLNIVTFNENFQASWIYHSMPVKRPGELLSGNLKALILKYFVPIYIVFFAMSLFIWGPAIIDDFILGLLNSMISLLVLSHFTEHYLPFSRQPNIKQQSGKFIQVMLQMLIIGVLVTIHYLLLGRVYVMYGVAVLSFVGLWFMVKNLQAISWTKISV
jgi:ABC-2 type transport system permease protein